MSSTPATVFLTRRKATFSLHEYDHPAGERNYGTVAAARLGIDPTRVFKTLLVEVAGARSSLAVGIVPVVGQLSLKAIATALGAKRADMCEPARAERTTGYVVGGISPFGQKRQLPTVIDVTAMDFESVFVSGGRRGLEIEIAPALAVELLAAVVAPIAG